MAREQGTVLTVLVALCLVSSPAVASTGAITGVHDEVREEVRPQQERVERVGDDSDARGTRIGNTGSRLASGGTVRANASAVVVAHIDTYEGIRQKVLRPGWWSEQSSDSVRDATRALAPDYDDAALDLLTTVSGAKTYGADTLIGFTGAGFNLIEAEQFENIEYLLEKSYITDPLRSRMGSLAENGRKIRDEVDVTGDGAYTFEDEYRLYRTRVNLLRSSYSSLDNYMVRLRSLAANAPYSPVFPDLDDDLNDQAYLALRTQLEQVRGVLVADYYATMSWVMNRSSSTSVARTAGTGMPAQRLDLFRFQGKGSVVDTVDTAGDYALYRIHVSDRLAGSYKELAVQVRTRGPSGVGVGNVSAYLKKGQTIDVGSPSGIRPSTELGPRLFDTRIKRYEIGSTNPFAPDNYLEAGDYYLLVKGTAPLSYSVHAGVYSLSISDPIGTPVQPEVVETGSIASAPDPVIQNVHLGEREVETGENVTVNVSVTNRGATADWQSIAIAFPDLNDTTNVTVVGSDFPGSIDAYGNGTNVTARYGTTSTALDYALVEAGDSWQRGETKWLRINVTPTRPGSFPVYVKSVARDGSAWQFAPFPTRSPTLDQQSEYVREEVVSVTEASQGNTAPTAMAGPDRTVRPEEYISLDGSNSSDPDGDPLSYTWRIVSGPGSLRSPTGRSTTYVAPSVTEARVAQVELTVSDPNGSRSTDPLNVTVSPNEGPPVDVTSFTASNPSGNAVNVTFDTNVSLNNASLVFVDSSGSAVRRLSRAAVSESGTGPFTYDWSGTLVDGTYTVDLRNPSDAAGSEDSPQSITVGPPVVTGCADVGVRIDAASFQGTDRLRLDLQVTRTNASKRYKLAVDLATAGGSVLDSYVFVQNGSETDGFVKNITRSKTSADLSRVEEVRFRVYDCRRFVDSAVVTPPTKPTARFTVNTTSPAPGETVVFDASNSTDTNGTIQRYEWDFDGNGTVDATGMNVTHAYETEGYHTSELTVIDNESSRATARRTLEVGNPVVTGCADLGFRIENYTYVSETELRVGLQVTRTSSIKDYKLAIDVIAATGETDTHVFIQDGANTSGFNERLHQRDLSVDFLKLDSIEFHMYGCSGTSDSENVETLTQPNASLRPNTTSVDIGGTIAFDGSRSSDDDGSIESYEWDLDGDGTVDRTGHNATYTYETEGYYTPALTVTDDLEVSATDSQMVEVGDPVVTGCADVGVRISSVGFPSYDRMAVELRVSRTHPIKDYKLVVDLKTDSGATDSYVFVQSGANTDGFVERIDEWNVSVDLQNVTELEFRLYDCGRFYDRSAVDPPDHPFFSVRTEPVREVGPSTATVRANLTHLGSSTGASVGVVYWPTGDRDNATATDRVHCESRCIVQRRLTGLLPNRTYAVAAVATNESGTDTSGRVLEFTTDTDRALTVDWTRELDSRRQYSTPAVGTERVFVGGLDATLFALDRSNGSVAWRFEREGSLADSSPALRNGTVYVGSGGGVVYALNATTGSPVWTVRTDSAIVSSPRVARRTVYVGSNDGTVLAINASDGTVRWRTHLGSPVLSKPATGSDTVYVTTNAGSLVALDPDTGAEEWVFDTEAELGHSSPVTEHGRVYLAADELYALSGSDGTEQWAVTYGGAAGSTPAVANGRAYVGSAAGEITAVNTSTGTVVWTFDTGSPVASSPSVVSERVIVGSGTGRVYVLDAENGTAIGGASFPSPIRSTPVPVDGSVFVTLGEGPVVSLDRTTTSGTIANVTTLPSTVTKPPETAPPTDRYGPPLSGGYPDRPTRCDPEVPPADRNGSVRGPGSAVARVDGGSSTSPC